MRMRQTLDMDHMSTPIKVKYRHSYLRKHPKFTGCLIDKVNDKAWYKNGERHRVDAPAVESVYGSKWWYKNGQKHRDNGPAVEWSNGCKEWYLNGKEFTEQEHRALVRQIKLKMLDISQSTL
jgi:hypothetical protein